MNQIRYMVAVHGFLFFTGASIGILMAFETVKHEREKMRKCIPHSNNAKMELFVNSCKYCGEEAIKNGLIFAFPYISYPLGYYVHQKHQ